MITPESQATPMLRAVLRGSVSQTAAERGRNKNQARGQQAPQAVQHGEHRRISNSGEKLSPPRPASAGEPDGAVAPDPSLPTTGIKGSGATFQMR